MTPWRAIGRWLRRWAVDTAYGFAGIARFIVCRIYIRLAGVNRVRRWRHFITTFRAHYRAAGVPIPITAIQGLGWPPSCRQLTRRQRARIAWAFAQSASKPGLPPYNHFR